MSFAVLEAVDVVSSSMSSSFKSPTTSPLPSDDHVRTNSPAFSLAGTSGAPNARVTPTGPGGDGAAKAASREVPQSSGSGGGLAPRSRPNLSGTSAGVAKARVRVPAAAVEQSPTSSPAPTPVNAGATTPNGGAPHLGHTNVTPKRQTREPLQQRYFDAAAVAPGENPFSSSAQKLMRSDTAPPAGRDLFTAAISVVQNQQSPQQLQRREQHVQAGAWAEQLTSRCFRCSTCMRVVTDPVLLAGDRKMVCRKCVPLPPAVASVVELPVNLAEAIKEISSVAEMHTAATTATATAAVCAPAPAIGGPRHGSTTTAATAATTAAPGAPPPSAAATKASTEAAAEGEKEGGHRPAAARGAGSAGGRPSGPTSRTVKTEADKKYEAAEYTAALELYTKAIRMQPLDGQTQLRFLYGNRSAAHFMAQRYAECVADCLEVVKLEPGNVKMLSRAARSAATMGDLKQAITILESTPAGRMTDSMTAELTRYRTGLELYQKAESSFGTAESDERYCMLVAQFSDTIAFRIRFAESLMHRKQYTRAADVLEVTSSSARPPKLCRLLAFCLYQSGFERFDYARQVLRDAAQLDPECGALLRLINIVDDGKHKGNTSFTEKRFAAAVEHYTDAINTARDNDQILRILFCNRAAANKELGRYREGVDDCTKAIALDQDFYKAYARRARCHQNLGDHFAAVQDFRRATQYDKSDKELARELRQAEANLQREAEREKDYYYQLGLQSTATEKDIKLKYRELSLRWHPDKCVNLDAAEKERAEHKFKVISEAYGTLIDPAKRREYDLRTSRSAFGGKAGSFSGFSSTYSSYNTEQFRGRPRGATGGYW